MKRRGESSRRVRGSRAAAEPPPARASSSPPAERRPAPAGGATGLRDTGLRDTGIDLIGPSAWSTHFCQFYETRQDLVDVLVPYFAAGLKSNEYCMWITSPPLDAAGARRALRRAVPDLARYEERGQIEILPHTDWYLIGGAFDATRVLAGWVERLEQALARGFDGLRLSGNTFWLERSGWRDFQAYEEAVDSVIAQYRMMALCTYSLEKCGAAEIVDVIQNHQFALIKRDGRWQILENTERKRARGALLESEARFQTLFDSMTEGFALHEIIRNAAGIPVDYRFLDLNPAFERLTGLKRADVAGRCVSEILPHEAPFWVAKYGPVAVTGKPVHFDSPSAALGRHFEVLAYRPAPGQFAVIFKDVSERERARVDLAEARTRAEALASMVMDLNAGRDLGEILRAVLTRMAGILGGEDGSLYLLTADGRNLLGAQELEPRERVGMTFPLELVSQTRRALETRRPVFLTRPMAQGFEAEWLQRSGIAASLIVPLLADRRHLGVIYVNFRSGERALPESDLAFAAVFAGQCALAIDRAQLQEREKAGYVAALRASEERLAITLHSIADGVIATDTGGNVEDMNPVAERLTGWSLAEARGRPLAAVFHVINEDTRAEVESPAHRVLHDGLVVGLANHTALVARDGTEHPVADSGAPIRDAAGQTRGVVLVFRDMTEQRRARRAEQRLQRALLTLGECNEVLVRATDEAQLLQSICRTIVETAGYPMSWVGYAEQDERKTIRPVAQAGIDPGHFARINLTWADEERGRGPAATAIRTGLPVTARDVPGAADHAVWRASAIRQDCAAALALPLPVDGRTLGALVIFAREPDAFDADEMKLLRELADDLAFGISALRGRAARAKLESQLLFADRMASMGQLSAGVAHEVNNPLAYVIGNLDLASMELAGLENDCRGQAPVLDARLPAIRERIAQMQEAAERIRVVVRDLKVFSRPDDEGIGAIDLVQVIDSAINMLANEIRHRARLVRDYGQLPPIRGNAARLGQVFLNLLTNAAQAIPEGATSEHEIRVSGHSRDGQVTVAVSDTGQGIRPEHLPRVFDPFFTTKPLGVGTGLGLSITHGIVAAFGGTITVESEVGAGATFRITLPAAPDEPPRPQAAVAAPAAPPEPPAATRRARILVIDDEEMMCAVLRAVLSGHDVVALTDAQQALERLTRGERFDVILCDMMMPQMTGMDFHARVAESLPDQVQRIIFMSGGAFTARAREFLAEVPNPRIDKPFDTPTLLALVNARLA
jgi:PAS domain S-box-containing protein